MSTVQATVYVCSSGASVASASSVEYPVCTAGSGQWETISIQQPFDPSTLDASALSGAFGAGFTVMATGLVIVWACRQLIRSIRLTL